MLENLAPFENEAAICLLNFDVVYLEIARRYFYQDSFTQKRFLIKYLSNWKTIFWVISQEQHNIKTLEFTETNSYFYSFTYGKVYVFSSSSYQWLNFFWWICKVIEKL